MVEWAAETGWVGCNISSSHLKCMHYAYFSFKTLTSPTDLRISLRCTFSANAGRGLIKAMQLRSSGVRLLPLTAY